MVERILSGELILGLTMKSSLCGELYINYRKQKSWGIQWRVLHGIVAVNAFVSVINYNAN